jgi:uncharacterized radical SAM superfamily protein
MNEYEHLKNQKDEMLRIHAVPGTRCPFGCPHDGEKELVAQLAVLAQEVKELREDLAEMTQIAEKVLDPE